MSVPAFVAAALLKIPRRGCATSSKKWMHFYGQISFALCDAS